jgi:hypothetical protein
MKAGESDTGCGDGGMMGATEGNCEGENVGDWNDTMVGIVVGCLDGMELGSKVGGFDGGVVGRVKGTTVGAAVAR